MTTDEQTTRKPPGRPRKYVDGRHNATVRFTPKRYADLKAEADLNGRSVSEEVEYRIEQYDTLQNVLATLDTAFNQIRDLQQRLAATKRDDERLVEMIEAAVTRAMERKGGDR
jgi:hypothetical protein